MSLETYTVVNIMDMKEMRDVTVYGVSETTLLTCTQGDLLSTIDLESL